MNAIKNRLKKNITHKFNYAKKHHITCFRVYNKDIPEHPFILDWYETVAFLWFHKQKKEITIQERNHYESCIKTIIKELLNINEEQLFVKQRNQQKGAQQQYKKLNQIKKTIIVNENQLKFEINCTNYLDTGLFLDHRNTRQYVQRQSKNKRFLNLFAYTGSFTCYARAGAALSTTTIDLNPNYIEWAKRNMQLNNFEIRQSDRFICDNALSFIKQEQSRNRYDIIVCDPPTFSNSKKMKHSFNIDSHYPALLQHCVKLLAPEGKLIFSTNSKSFKLAPKNQPKNILIKQLTPHLLPFDFKKGHSHHCWELKKKQNAPKTDSN